MDEACVLKFDSLFAKLTSEEWLNTDLAQNCLKIKEGVSQVVSFASEYDFSTIKANGYWSFVSSVYKLFNLIEIYLKKKQKTKELELVTFCYLKLLHFLLEHRKQTQNCLKDHNFNEIKIQNSNLFVPISSNAIKALHEELNKTILIDSDELVTIYSTFGAFWFCTNVGYFFNVYVFAVASFASSFPFSLKCLWDQKFRAYQFLKKIKRTSFNCPFKIWELVNRQPFLFIESLIFGRKYSATSVTIQVSKQNQIIVNKDGSSFTINENSESFEGKIRCRIMTNKEAPKFLLFHCHGGGFVSHSPDCHETYLRQWSDEIPNLIILSVDYTLKAQFPLPLQEILDVYLWVTSDSPEVEKTLGFKPDKIVLCGDSAGANLITCLLFLLNDLRNLNENLKQKIKMPVSIVPIYAAFLLTPFTNASRIMGTNDPLISPGVLLFCSGVYSGLMQQIYGEGSSKEKYGIFSRIISYFSKDEKPWFICDLPKFEERLHQLMILTYKPYFSPLIYSHFDSLKDVKLFLVSSEFCPLLDESVTFAKFWKGSIQFDVVTKLPHGFLNFVTFCEEAKNASKLCAQRIQESFQ